VSVIALDAPPVDDAAMTLLPLARAKVTLRMGRDEDVDAATAAFVRHLESHVPWGASVSVTTGTPIEPFAAATDGPAYAAARAAFAAAWGVEPVEIGVGGSINFIASFARAFPAAEILITGVEDPDTRAHGANESLHLAEFERACVGEALLLAGLAGLADGCSAAAERVGGARSTRRGKDRPYALGRTIRQHTASDNTPHRTTRGETCRHAPHARPGTARFWRARVRSSSAARRSAPTRCRSRSGPPRTPTARPAPRS
jgi:hypothetical protein